MKYAVYAVVVIGLMCVWTGINGFVKVNHFIRKQKHSKFQSYFLCMQNNPSTTNIPNLKMSKYGYNAPL